MTRFQQNFSSLAPPTEAFKRLWKAKRLVHDGNPVLRYQAANVAVKTNTDGFHKPAKDISGDRIDGIVGGQEDTATRDANVVVNAAVAAAKIFLLASEGGFRTRPRGSKSLSATCHNSRPRPT